MLARASGSTNFGEERKMKRYLVLVEAEDFIDVEAENDEDGIRQAIEKAMSDYNSTWKGTIMNSEELENEESV